MNITLLGDLWPLDVDQVSIPDLGRSADLCIANLEGTTYGGRAPSWPKPAPSYRGSSRALAAMRPRLGALVLTLANNHTMDWGPAGLNATVEDCRNLEIDVVGAGQSVEEAEAPLLLDTKDGRVAILARCETQFGGATRTRPGVADVEKGLCRRVQEVSHEADAVVVTIHGGPELSPWPSPQWQELLRSLVDAGAAIVHGHHAHAPQGYEIYNGGVIVYGPGSFLVDPVVWGNDPYHPHVLWSLAAECSLGPGSPTVSVRTLLSAAASSGLETRFADIGEYREHAAYLAQCNRPLSDPELLEALWQETAVRMYELFYASWLGHPSPRLQGMDRGEAIAACRSAAGRLIRGRKALAPEEAMLHYHLFSCQAHREAVATALGVLSGELEDLRSAETGSLADTLMPWSASGLTEMHWGGPGRRRESVEGSR